jgi:hypothetical protein
MIACAALGGCGPSPITAERIESAVAKTFANLVHVQVSWLGLPPMAASDFAAKAACRRLTGTRDAGSGDWMCTVDWQGPDRRSLRDTYDLFVGADGCYRATVEGGSLGGPTLKASTGAEVRNLLYTFEGCLDTTQRAESVAHRGSPGIAAPAGP